MLKRHPESPTMIIVQFRRFIARNVPLRLAGRMSDPLSLARFGGRCGQLANLAIQLKEFEAGRTIHLIVATCQLNQKLIENSRYALADSMDISSIAKGVALDNSASDCMFDYCRCFRQTQRRDLNTHEAVKILPNMADLFPLIRTTRDPHREQTG